MAEAGVLVGTLFTASLYNIINIIILTVFT